MAFFSNIREQIETDDTIRRVKKYGYRSAKAFPKVLPKYLLAKIPVVLWLPRYDLKWIINDVFAGITMGVLLIPQALAYAKVATIPPQFALIASFSPALVYFFMGTSKDISVGPTSIIALLTSQIIKDFTKEGFRPEIIAAAIAFWVSIYSWILGFLQLGWLLDFISLPVLTGFVSATALDIILNQLHPLFGLTTASSGEASIIHDFFANLPKTELPTLAVGISGIIMLVFLQQIGKYWGKKYKFIWFISIFRNAIVLVLFTTISYLVNRNLEKPIFPVSSTVNSGLIAPKLPNMDLVFRLARRSIAVFVAASIEHLAVGKAFGRKNGYTIDQAQELTVLGTTNFVSSLFGGMAVSGAISRTSVNSESGVKSPLSGLVSATMVLLSIYKLSGVLFWIPKATLSAIIVTAVWLVVVPTSVFYKYWRISLIDFVSSQLAFWTTIFVSAERGIQFAVLFGLIYILVRIAFAHISLVTDENRSLHYPSEDDSNLPYVLPKDTKVFKFHQPILFPNAERVRNSVMVAIQTYSVATNVQSLQTERMWSDAGERKIAELRAKAGVSDLVLPQTHVVILDLTHAYIDTTGLQALADLKVELIKYCGPSLQLRFVGMHRALRKKFEQIGWRLSDAGLCDGGGLEADLVYGSIGAAVSDSRRFDESDENGKSDISVLSRETV